MIGSSAFLSSASARARIAPSSPSVFVGLGAVSVAVVLRPSAVVRTALGALFFVLVMRRWVLPSRPDLSAAADHKLGGGEAFGAHRAVGVEARRRDADFGAEAELATIGKPRRRVDEHGRGIDFAEPLLGNLTIVGDDRFSVMTAVVLDVLDRGRDSVDHAHREDEVEIFGGPVSF